MGIADYEKVINDLSFCDDDARDMRDTLLLDTEHWSDSNIDLILDSDATVGRIKSAIDAMLASAGTGDVCLFYFSGHGYYVADVFPFDETDGDDETLVAYDDDILDDDLETWLSGFTDQCVCVIIDTCFAGGMAKSAGAASAADWVAGMAEDIARVAPPRATNRPGAGTKDLDDLVGDDFVNLVALMACRDWQTAEEDPRLQNGVFTFFVVQAMRDLDADTNGNTFTSAEEVFAWAAPRAEAWNPSQAPYLYDADTDEPDQVPVIKAADRDPESVIKEAELPFGGGIKTGCAPPGPGAGRGVAVAWLAALAAAGIVARGRRRRAPRRYHR